MASVTIPDELLASAGLTEQEIAAELALELYRREKLTMGQASRLAGVHLTDFWKLMTTRDIYMHFDEEDLEHDIATLRSLERLRSEMTHAGVYSHDPETGLYVGHIPGFRGAHSAGDTIEELMENLTEVVEMLLEDGEPVLEGEFVGTATVKVA
jgi:predicted HTH domain antitoxin/predicted RNase H-like HicB family nuclease